MNRPHWKCRGATWRKESDCGYSGYKRFVRSGSFCRAAIRHDKLSERFTSFIALAASLISLVGIVNGPWFSVSTKPKNSARGGLMGRGGTRRKADPSPVKIMDRLSYAAYLSARTGDRSSPYVEAFRHRTQTLRTVRRWALFGRVGPRLVLDTPIHLDGSLLAEAVPQVH